MSAHMTAQQAADHVYDMAGDRQTFRDWFAAHWPAGGAVTGEQVRNAMTEALPITGHKYETGDYTNVARALNAHLAMICVSGPWHGRSVPVEPGFSAPDVYTHIKFEAQGKYVRVGETMAYLWQPAATMDVEAVAREIAGPVVLPVKDVNAICEAFRREHTSELLALNSYDTHQMNVAAADLRTVLLTHAMDVGTATPQWIKRPKPQAGKLVVPGDGIYAKRYENGAHSTSNTGYRTGEHMTENITAIRRIDTDAPTTWIERTPATAGGWTTSDIPAGVLVMYNESGPCRWITEKTTRKYAAEDANHYNIHIIAVLPATPPVEAAPFKATYERTRTHLERELAHLGARDVLPEADCDPSQVRLDGQLRSSAKLRGPA